MISPRERLREYLRAPFWEYVPLLPWARRALVVLAALTLVVDSLYRATNASTSTIASALVTTGISIALAVFAWRPPIGTAVLIAVAIIGAAAGVTDSVVAGTAPLGLVAFSCSARLSTTYVVAWLAWVVASVARPESPFEPLGGVVTTIFGVISMLIGIVIRQQFERSRALAHRLAETELEVAEQLRHERDLIADELHDIVAHEITIVALHAAVLERTEDTRTRAQSQTAIREAAVQALTDIRRVLGMVRGEENLAPERIPSPEGLDETIADVIRELGQAGISVTTQVPEDVRLPSTSLVALTRVIRESSTNVLKHATGARNVRIALSVERGWATLEFSDDSPPARTAGLPSSGYGIMRLRERFRLFGGSFDAERRPAGWTVTAALPLES